MEPPGTKTFSSSSSSSSRKQQPQPQPQPAIMNIRKNVSFNNMVIMRPIPSVESFTKAEKDAAWHSVNDLNAIKSRERALRNNNSKTSTLLHDMLKQEIGIESKVEVQKRRLRVDLRLCQVLDEQDKQWDNEIENPDELAKVSSITSQESMELAFKRAQDVAKQIHIDIDDRDNNRNRKYPPMTRVGRSAGNMLLTTTTGNTNRRSSSSRDMLSKFTGGGGLGLGSGSSSKKNGNATWGIATTPNGMMMNNSHKSTGGMMMMMRSKNMFLGGGSSSLSLSPTRSSSSSGKNGNASWKVTTTTEDGQHEHEHEQDDTTNRDEDDDPTLYNPTPQSSNPKIKSILRSSKVSHVYQSSPALLLTTTGINCLQRPTPVPVPPPLPTSPAYDRWNAMSKSKSKTKSSKSSKSNKTKTTTTTLGNGGSNNNNMANQQWNVTVSPPTTTTKSSASGNTTTKPKYDLQKLAGLVGV